MEYYFTPERLEELKKELQQLKTEKRLEIADRLQRAKELGDLSENSEYFEAREEQAQVEGRIIELEQMVKNAAIIPQTVTGSHVKIGSTIEVRKDGQAKRFRIVGSNEVKPEEGLISNESPLGRAFLDKKAGDVVSVKTPGGEAQYEIVKIE